jgi:hypothetical protein
MAFSVHNQRFERGAPSLRCFRSQLSPLTPALSTARLACMEHPGGCHCGNIHVRLRLSKPPENNPLRACTCSFCRSHRPRIVTNREGLFEVWADDWSLVENYRFGTRTCEFLICRRCGVFIAAVTETAEGTRAVVNANCLVDRERFTSDPLVHNFNGETSETRSARHAANWMPATIRH